MIRMLGVGSQVAKAVVVVVVECLSESDEQPLHFLASRIPLCHSDPSTSMVLQAAAGLFLGPKCISKKTQGGRPRVAPFLHGGSLARESGRPTCDAQAPDTTRRRRARVLLRLAMEAWLAAHQEAGWLALGSVGRGQREMR